MRQCILFKPTFRLARDLKEITFETFRSYGSGFTVTQFSEHDTKVEGDVSVIVTHCAVQYQVQSWLCFKCLTRIGFVSASVY